MTALYGIYIHLLRHKITQHKYFSSPTSNIERMTSLLQSTKNAIVLYNYEPKEHDELKLMKGEQIIVLEEVTENDGWSLGQNQDGVKGIPIKLCVVQVKILRHHLNLNARLLRKPYIRAKR